MEGNQNIEPVYRHSTRPTRGCHVDPVERNKCVPERRSDTRPKESGDEYEKTYVAQGKTISCPIKLPPLDGYKLHPGEISKPGKNKPVTQQTSPVPKKTEFHEILTQVRSTPAIPAAKQDTADATEVGRQLESFFLSLIFKHAFNSSISKGIYGNSYESGMYLEMFIDAVVEEAGRTSNLGIADLVAADINRKSDNTVIEDANDDTEELQGMRQSNNP
jgi:hypothetical protein